LAGGRGGATITEMSSRSEATSGRGREGRANEMTELEKVRIGVEASGTCKLRVTGSGTRLGLTEVEESEVEQRPESE
jgi:hypothetical protein